MHTIYSHKLVHTGSSSSLTRYPPTLNLSPFNAINELLIVAPFFQKEKKSQSLVLWRKPEFCSWTDI